MSDKQRIVIVGGGLCGLVAATALQKDYSVSILDKGFGIGGRLASRRLRDSDQVLGLFDYGMQSFTAEHPAFRTWVQTLVTQGVVTQWTASDHTSNEAPASQSFYRGVESNRAIAQYLAHDLNVITQTRVERLIWNDPHWVLHTTDDRSFEADAILMTAPVPQALDIFDQSGLSLSENMRSQLERVTYAPCLSLMAVFDQPSAIPEPEGLKLDQSILYWIASNHKKGISQGHAITLLGTPDYSQANWYQDSEQIIAEMLAAAKEWVSPKNAIATRLHRWKYSYPTQVFGAKSAPVIENSPLILAGDAFCETPVEIQQSLEQAYLSGIDAAEHMKRLLLNLQ